MVINIGARTREDIKYQCVICDTYVIQYEKPFLLHDMLNETIIKHIKSEIPEYTYDIHKDQIAINIGVLPNKGLKLVLSKDMSSLPNESARISRIESLITRLTPSEIIESHTIKINPEHDDFKKTPAFRYFEALTIYAIMSLQKNDSIHIAIKVLLVILSLYDITTRICLLFGCIKYDFIESRLMVPGLLGCLLWFLGDPVGILLYCMSLLIIFAVIFKIMYYRFLWNLLQ